MSKNAKTRKLLVGILSFILWASTSEAEPGKNKSKRKHESPKVPIVYDASYEFNLFGLQRYHPFANKKYSGITQYLINKDILAPDSLHSPLLVSKEMLEIGHTVNYIASLAEPTSVLSAFEEFIFPKKKRFEIKFEKNTSEISARIVASQMAAAGGTIRALDLAVSNAVWAINLGGGFHHAHSGKGHGFCLIADAPIAIQKYLDQYPESKVLIIDLDAHHGDGNAAFFANEQRVAIFDIYNEDAFPEDKYPVKFDFPLPRATADESYLATLQEELPKAIATFQPQLIYYNAGTDIHEKDLIGEFKISAKGIIQRDEFVFRTAINAKIPIFMTLAGGYTDNISEVIGKSIENLHKKHLINLAP